MRVYIDLGYSLRGVADITAAEIETFSKVLDRLRCTDTWYGGKDDLVLKKDRDAEYNIRVLPSAVRVVEPAPTPDEEQQNG